MLATIAGPVKAALTDQILIRKGKIWIERRKIGHVVIFQASVSRIFNAAALAAAIASVAAGDLAVVIASAAEGDFLAEVIASLVAADSAAIVLAAVAADLADSAAEGSEADVDNEQLNQHSNL